MHPKYVLWTAVAAVALLDSTRLFARDSQQVPIHWPPAAKVYFISPADGATIEGPVKVVMGLSGLGIAPAGVRAANTGHHHILVDTDLPSGADLEKPLMVDAGHRHFGAGQTEATLTLAPGKHTLQLVVGDHAHVPHDPPLASAPITITVK